MKTVFTNRELPHIWANQLQHYGRGSNMFFEKETIYSYGKHFPIATIIEDKKVVLFNSNPYSTTTNKHKSFVSRAIPAKYTVFDVPGCTINHRWNIEKWIDNFNTSIEKGIRAREWASYRFQSAENVIDTLIDYIRIFELNVANYPGLQEILKRKDQLLSPEILQELKEKEKLRKQKELEKNKQNIQEWIEGTRNHISHKIDKVFLRTCKDYEDIDTVETSKGARVKYKSAKLLYDMIQKGKDIKGHKIDGYTVIGINGVLTIGCHKIERKEIERFAKLQNW